MEYLNKDKLIHQNQSGFRQKHSCQTVLVKLIDRWMDCIDKGDMIGTLFLDFRKTFDLVDHATLITKLSLYKFSPSAIRWFTSYLCCRQQAIESGRGLLWCTVSATKIIISGTKNIFSGTKINFSPTKNIFSPTKINFSPTKNTDF